MKYFSLFSGVEGFGLGLPEDWKCVGFSEIDRYASMVLKYRFPRVKNYGDISKIDWSKVPGFDLLTGGSPCQDFSIAGKRKGLGGSRSALAWEYIRCLRNKKPKYFIWENVKGSLSARRGWDIANLICAFSESGYSLWWQVLNAKDFGVPQNRERIFIVGFRNGCAKEIFFEKKANRKSDKIQREAGEQQPGLFSQAEEKGRNKPSVKGRRGGQGQPSNGLKEITSGLSQGYRVYDPNGLSVNIASQAGGMGAKTGLYVVRQPLRFQKRNQKNIDGDYSFTVDTTNTSGIKIGDRVRRLMPIECERLMSWPDNWTRYGCGEAMVDSKANIMARIEMSDNQRYKMCGNGVVSEVIKYLVEYLLI